MPMPPVSLEKRRMIERMLRMGMTLKNIRARARCCDQTIHSVKEEIKSRKVGTP
jgi:DNA-binding transcriptional MerR regulator